MNREDSVGVKEEQKKTETTICPTLYQVKVSE